MTVVYKFGGSSLADKNKVLRAAAMLAEASARGEQVVCVVSAQGDDTDALLQLAADFSSADAGRELDALLATGEQKSAALLAMALESMGVPACSMNALQAGICCSSEHGNARITRICGEVLQNALRSGRIPVVTGFQGVNELGDICTLGRGGSDATACALAAALGGRCVICTDVDGVFSSDPRLVSDAKQIGSIPHEAMLELAANGAGVLMDRSARLAMKYTLPLCVRSCEETSLGTFVGGSADESVHFYGAALQSGLTVVSGSVLERDLAALCSALPGFSGSFLQLYRQGNEVCFSFLAPAAMAENVKAQLSFVCRLAFSEKAAKVCVAGSGSLETVSLQRLLKLLQNRNIPLLALCQSAGSIWAVVPEEYKNAVLGAVHEEFIS
ncbi:MAG: aspartate kinase [Oscillospiraceae bacterium]|nr:aspartate kinase [Oscillospiraceae bacterium]